MINLETGRIDDLRPIAGREGGVSLHNPCEAEFSADGKHVAIQSGDRKSAWIMDLSTGKAATIRCPDGASLVWAGSRLLLSTWTKPVEVYDVNGQHVEELRLYAYVAGSDQAGKRLLAVTDRQRPATIPMRPDGDLVWAVITPNGKVLREVASLNNACDRAFPLLSRQGTYAAAIYLEDEPPGVSIRVVSVTSGETVNVTPWGWPLAVADTGEGMVKRWRNGATYPRIEFWTKQGKCQGFVESAMDGTILGDEFFFVQPAGDTPILKAIPLPKAQPGGALPRRGTN